MEIIARPVDSDLIVDLLVDGEGITVNGVFTAFSDIPSKGPVSVEGRTLIVEYGERGGFSRTLDHTIHSLIVEPSKWVCPEPDPEAEAQAALEAERQVMSAKKWQLRSVMGQNEWSVIETLLTDPVSILDFPLDTQASWDLRCLIEDIDDIPRISETVDLLAYALRKDDAAVDNLFRMAAAKRK